MVDYANNDKLKLFVSNMKLLSAAFAIVAVALFFTAKNSADAESPASRYARIQAAFNGEVNSLLNFAAAEKRNFERLKPQRNKPELFFFEKLYSEKNSYFVSVYDSAGELVAWNENFRKINGARPVFEMPPMKPYRERDNLFEIISVVNRFKIGGDVFYLKTSFIFKKYFSLHNSYEEHGDFAEKIKVTENAKLVSSAEEGETASPVMLNGKPIAYAVAEKNAPGSSLPYALSLLMFFVGYFLALADAVRGTENTARKTAAIAAISVASRLLLFFLFDDFQITRWAVTEPVYFSSDFANGFFATLLSLFFSALFALAIFVSALSYVNKKEKFEFGFAVKVFLLALSLVAFPADLRSFGATVRSFIFDSNIRIFTDNLDVFDFVTLFYLADILLAAIAFVLLAVLIVRFAVKLEAAGKGVTLGLFFVSVFVFDFFNAAPQSPLLFKTVFTAVLFLVAFGLFPRASCRKKALYVSLFAAVASVFLLNFHNVDFEKNLYAFAARKIAEPNKFYYDHLIRKETEKIARKLVREKIRLFNNSLAYRLWNYSRLPFETFSSALEISDARNDTVVFYYNSDKIDEEIAREKLVAYSTQRAENIAVRGLADYSPKRIFDSRLPDFFVADNQASVSLARSLNLGLMIFRNGDLMFSSLPATLTKTKRTELLNAALKRRGKITSETISGKRYDLLTIENGEDRAVYIFAKPAVHIAVRVFELLKIFAVFLALIFLPAFVMLLPRIFRMRIRFSFRGAIFFGLVFVSIVPLVLLALYFRNLSEEKNLSSTFFKLNKKALAVGKYLKKNEAEEYDPIDLFEKASEELRFDFSVFYDDKIFYTTHPLFFENGILPDVLNPETIVNIEVERLNDILLIEKIERYERNVFYSKFSFGGENYIIQIDEAFNPILLPMSEKELDMMLITSYSVAALGILLLGFVLAYYLSKPVNELTAATREIARGNLDLRLRTKAFGEVKELIDGFNYMSEEIKNTQQKLLESERESAWREMARQVAHEIKNPLTPMKLSLQQLIAMKKEGDENFDSAFDKITASVLSQIELLKNIASEFSALGKMPKFKLREINLFELLRKIKSLYSDKRVEIRLDSSLADVTVNSDEEYLTRIFVNLFANAVEAGASVIEVYALETEKSVTVYVKNNGAKIPDEAREKIFDKNYTTKKKGSGLGLFISARFMRETEGEIALEKSDENETIFKLSFKK